MKLYVQDHGWAGCLVVIAYSEVEARMYMEGRYNYAPLKEVDEMEIVCGLLIENTGDS